MLSPGQILHDHVFQRKKPFGSLSKPMAEVERRSRIGLGFCPQSYVKYKVISDFGAFGKEASIRINLLTSNITVNKHKLKSLSKCMTVSWKSAVRLQISKLNRIQNKSEQFRCKHRSAGSYSYTERGKKKGGEGGWRKNKPQHSNQTACVNF